MAITTIVLSAGFFALSLSAFQMTSHLGILTGAIGVAAIATDLLLLPALLLTLAPRAATAPDPQDSLPQQTHSQLQRSST